MARPLGASKPKTAYSLGRAPEENRVTTTPPLAEQWRRPTGWLGRLIVRQMNWHHAKLTAWGLGNLSISPRDTILDVGCGGGSTVKRLAALVTQGTVTGLDYSEASLAVARGANARWIAKGRVELRQGSVSQLPFPDNAFDLVTAVETHFFWPDLVGDLREILRTLKPGGTVMLLAEVYKGGDGKHAKVADEFASLMGLTLLTPEGHREAFVRAGYSDVRIVEDRGKGWICGVGRKTV
jgi:SAM-dependent methyltransferase